jgi:predicted aconitase
MGEKRGKQQEHAMKVYARRVWMREVCSGTPLAYLFDDNDESGYALAWAEGSLLSPNNNCRPTTRSPEPSSCFLS